MEPLTIKTPADVLSFIGHTLGFWPHESLVCITLDANRVGATLRVDLPNREGGLRYARTVRRLPRPRHQRRQRALRRVHLRAPETRAAQAARSNHRRTDVRAGRARNDHPGRAPRRRHHRLPVRRRSPGRTDTPAEVRPSPARSTPNSSTAAAPSNPQTASPCRPRQKKPQPLDAVEDRVKAIHRMNPGDALEQARTLWTDMLDAITYPDDDQTIRLIANFQFPAIRDQLMADIPGIDEPMDRVLLAQTHGKPQWSRVEWAQQLLLHAYTHSSTKHSAPILTAIAFVNWWEGRGSKAHQFLQLALEADPSLPFGQAQRPHDRLRNGRRLEHGQGPGLPAPGPRSLISPAVIGTRTTTAGRSGASSPPPRPTRPDRNSTPACAPRKGK